MAKGEENLIRAEDLTSEQLRERAQKGGIASGEARREKKRLREAVEAYLSGKVVLDDGTEVDRYTRAAGLLFEELESEKGNRVGAFNALRDIIGEKPKDEVDVGGKINFNNGGLQQTLEALKRED